MADQFPTAAELSALAPPPSQEDILRQRAAEQARRKADEAELRTQEHFKAKVKEYFRLRAIASVDGRADHLRSAARVQREYVHKIKPVVGHVDGLEVTMAAGEYADIIISVYQERGLQAEEGYNAPRFYRDEDGFTISESKLTHVLVTW